jgi:manganese/zinc/iron transport system permease protein
MNYLCELIVIALLVAIPTSLVGTFLMLRGIALIADAISHALVLGIVVMFLITQQLHSPLLIIGASAAGMLTVFLTEYVIQTHNIKKDAALGLVYPLLFSWGIVITSYCARNTHIDTDMVLLGELAFAPFDRWYYNSIDLGPLALWSMGSITFFTILCIILFYKQLVLATCDATQAYLQNSHPQVMYYLLMMLTTVTVVGSFNVVGSIVVVALIITPPATASLITHRLHHLILLSCGIGSMSAVFGCLIATALDVSIAGTIACCNGIFFLTVLSIQCVHTAIKKRMP